MAWTRQPTQFSAIIISMFVMLAPALLHGQRSSSGSEPAIARAPLSRVFEEERRATEGQRVSGSELRSRLLQAIRERQSQVSAQGEVASAEAQPVESLSDVGATDFAADFSPLSDVGNIGTGPVVAAVPIEPSRPVQFLEAELLPSSVVKVAGAETAIVAAGDASQADVPMPRIVGTISAQGELVVTADEPEIQTTSCQKAVALPTCKTSATWMTPSTCGCGTDSCGMSCGSSCGGCPKIECTSAFGGCGGCGQCGSLCGCDCCRPRFWGRVDVLLWHLDGYATPALITRSPAGTPADVAGLLGRPSTQVAYGNQSFGDGLRVGGRFQTGMWFDECRKVGLQGDFFALDGAGETTVFDNANGGTLARPFTNTDPVNLGPDAQVFGQPGLADGSVRFNTSSDIISAAPSLRFNLCCCGQTNPCYEAQSSRTDLLVGYRYFRMAEGFTSQEILNPTDPLFPAGTNYELNDSIQTSNDFHGIELGLSHSVQQGRFGWDIASLFAIGEVTRRVDLDGSTWIDVPDFRQGLFPGGFYVAPENIGRFVDRDYAVIPQARVNVNYCLGKNWRFRAGYNFLYLSSVFRPNTFMNTSFDGSQLAAAAAAPLRTVRPAVRKQDVFMHGGSVGLSYNF